MEISISRHQKIERLEAEKRQLEDRIKQLKHAAQTAERKASDAGQDHPWLPDAEEPFGIAAPAHWRGFFAGRRAFAFLLSWDFKDGV